MTAPERPALPENRVDIAAIPGGFTVNLNGNPLKTPGKRPLVVGGAVLARDIAAEIVQLLGDDPTALAKMRLGDPARAANFRIAAGAIDVIAGETGARARIIADLTAYGETDLICYRAARPEALAVHDDRSSAQTPFPARESQGGA